MTLCEENIMFWEFPGIGSKVIGLFLLWNLSFLEYTTGFWSICGYFLWVSTSAYSLKVNS